MRKGITPTISVVLLMGLTVAAAGSAFVYFQYMQPGEKSIQVNIDGIEVENCRNEGSSSFVDVRNTGEEAVNMSRLSIVLKGETVKTEPDPRVLQTGRVGTLKLKEVFLNSQTSLTLVGQGGSEQDFTCQIRDNTPPAPTTESLSPLGGSGGLP